MRIGFVQMAPVLGDPRATMEIVERLAPEFADADLIVLPELCNSGYNFESREQAWGLAEDTDGAYLRFIGGLCARQNQHIVTGFCEREGHRLYISAALVGPNGIVGVYRKMHLFCDEKDYFEPGNSGLPVFDIGKARIGVLICFDWVFPEVWRVLALRGADIICHPSNLVIPGKAQRAIPIHSLINSVYVITANRFGTEQNLTFTGLSVITDPAGVVLADAPPAEECVRIVEIEVAAARDKAVTSRNDLLADRRPEEYGALVERQGVRGQRY